MEREWVDTVATDSITEAKEICSDEVSCGIDFCVSSSLREEATSDVTIDELSSVNDRRPFWECAKVELFCVQC